MQKIFGIIGYKAGGARAEAEKKQRAEEKAAAYADHSVDSACSCLSDIGRDTAVSAGKFCCVSVETRAGSF